MDHPPIKRFEHPLGYLDYGDVPYDYRYEFEEEDSPFWQKAKQWVFIDVLRAQEKFKGHGKQILKDFLATLPKGIGVVANANPLDQDLDFLVRYKKQGFAETPDMTLFKIV